MPETIPLRESPDPVDFESLYVFQEAILGELIRGASARDVLDHVCRLVERQVPDSVCSIMVLDRERGVLQVEAAPGIPSELADELDGLVPSELAGSCGTAVFTGRAAIVEDTRTDARWADMQDLAVRAGIRACWSIPVRPDGQEVLGTFAISRTVPGAPSATLIALLESAGNVVGLTIKRLNEEKAAARMERALQRSQKLESLGLLAGGIAHDFNNILVGILGNADLLLEQLAEMPAVTESLAEIRNSAVRATGLTNQILSYAGKGRSRREAVEVRALLDDTLELVRHSVSQRAEVSVTLQESLPAVMADATQIRQVLMNLIVNAAEAIDEPKGTIRVRAESVHATADDEILIADGRLASGHYVSVAVTDDGCGMDGDTLGRVFDPFFTTKVAGRGLGLASVLGILKAHAGAIAVDSRAGAGSTFTVYLPVDASGDDVVPRGEVGLLALVVDDEAIVRKVTRRLLESAGYTVLTAADGVEALRLIEEWSGEIDILVIDQNMPGMTGLETARRVREGHPDLPIVIVTGGGDDLEDEARDLVVMSKPYARQDLLDTLAHAIA